MSEQNKDNLSREDWLSHDPASSKEQTPSEKGRPDEWGPRALRGRAILENEEEANELLAEIDAAIDENYGSSPVRDLPGKSNKSSAPWLAIAAAVLLLLLAAWWLIPGTVSTDQLYTDHFKHLDNSLRVTLMSESGGLADEMSESLRSYDRRDYEEAVQALSTYLGKHPDSVAVRLYYGISLLAEQEAEQAIDQFQQVRSAEIAPHFRESAEWYTALAELRAGRKQEARKTLESLVAGQHAFQEEARELLKALSDGAK